MPPSRSTPALLAALVIGGIVIPCGGPESFSVRALTAASPDFVLIERLGWLAGCWESRSRGGHTEEHWMGPDGGTMIGMSRMVRGGRTVHHEALRIEERQDGLVYVATPARQATTEFESTLVADTAVVFENPEHDFPQRISYRPVGADSLWARIEGTVDGQTRGADFRMGRCGPAEASDTR